MATSSHWGNFTETTVMPGSAWQFGYIDVSNRDGVGEQGYRRIMCRNITELRGLEPAATPEEIEAASRQYVRKVSGRANVSDANRDAFEQAVREVTETTTRLLSALPPRRQPPQTVPPLRRPEVQARIAARSS